jgi:hypothetical protein
VMQHLPDKALYLHRLGSVGVRAADH